MYCRLEHRGTMSSPAPAFICRSWRGNRVPDRERRRRRARPGGFQLAQTAHQYWEGEGYLQHKSLQLHADISIRHAHTTPSMLCTCSTLRQPEHAA